MRLMCLNCGLPLHRLQNLSTPKRVEMRRGFCDGKDPSNVLRLNGRPITFTWEGGGSGGGVNRFLRNPADFPRPRTGSSRLPAPFPPRLDYRSAGPHDLSASSRSGHADSRDSYLAR